MALRTRQREITRPGMIDLSSEQAKQVFLFQVTIARAEYEAGRLDEEELEEIQSSLTGFPTDNVCMYKKQFNEIFKRIKTMSLARECS